MLPLITLGIGILLTSCSNPMPSKDINKVKEQYEAQLMSVPGVVGVGIGECDGQPCLKVLVKQRTSDLEKQLPKQLEGFKVDIEETGAIDVLPQ
jgi:hypothetical protein